jgi:hypothetical protein
LQLLQEETICTPISMWQSPAGNSSKGVKRNAAIPRARKEWSMSYAPIDRQQHEPVFSCQEHQDHLNSYAFEFIKLSQNCRPADIPMSAA